MALGNLFILTFIPFYLALAYYLYDSLTKEIDLLRDERNALLQNKIYYERNVLEIAEKFNTVKDEIKEITVSPYARLAESLLNLNQQIIKIDGDISEVGFSETDEANFINDLKASVPKILTEKELSEQYNKISSQQMDNVQKQVDETGKGPTTNKTLNYEIELSEQLIKRADDLILVNHEKFKNLKKDLDSYWSLYEKELKTELEKYSQKQWNVKGKTGRLISTIKTLIAKLNNLKNNYLNKTDKALSASKNEDLRSDEIEKKIENEISSLETMFNTIESSKSYITKFNMINFSFEEDYDFLSKHFDKSFSYVRLISNHDIITKKQFDQQIAGKTNLLFYFELKSKRRVGYFTKKAYPKRTLITKDYKDDESFIVYFNKKEIYPANTETKAHFRTDSDHLIIVGNTLNDDGFWITPPNNQTGDKSILTLGFRTEEYKVGKGALFSNINQDTITSMEVYQIVFNN